MTMIFIIIIDRSLQIVENETSRYVNHSVRVIAYFTTLLSKDNTGLHYSAL